MPEVARFRSLVSNTCEEVPYKSDTLMGIRTDRLFGFDSVSEYSKALLHAPSTVVHRAFLTNQLRNNTKTLEREEHT